MTDALIYFTYTIIEYFIFWYTASVLIHKKPHITPRIIPGVLLVICMSIYSVFINNQFVSIILFIPLQVITLAYSQRMRLSEFIWMYVVEYIIITFCEVPVAFGLSFFRLDAGINSLFGSIFTFAIIVLICHFTPVTKLYSLYDNSSVKVKIIISNTSLIAILTALYFRVSPDNFIDNMIMLAVCILIILFVNIEIAMTQYDLASKQKQLEAYKHYLPIVEDLIKEVRMRQHDYDNTIQAITSLAITCSTYEELSAAINDFTDHIIASNITLNLLKLNFKLAAGFIFSKCNEAQSAGKTLTVKIDNYILNTSVVEYDLIEMLGILIDNAIEATPEHSEAFIELSNRGEQSVFTIMNLSPVISDTSIKKIFSDGFSTKKRNDGRPHGIGLSRLSGMVRTYKGSIDASNRDIDGTNYICFRLIV